MGRRYTGNMSGEQYCGNVNKMEVHDLDNEDTSSNGCQIDEIIAAGHDRPYKYLSDAKAAGYDNCAKCIGNSYR